MTLKGFLFTVLIFAQVGTIALAQDQQMHLTSYQSIYGDSSYSNMGWHVDMEDDLAVASTNQFPDDEGFGGAYLFKRDEDETWRTVARLKISNQFIRNERIEDVQIAGNAVMVATYLNVYFFEEPVGGWRDVEETARFSRTEEYQIEAAQFQENYCLIIERGDRKDPPILAHLYEKTGTSWADRRLIKTFSQKEGVSGFVCSNCIAFTPDFFAFSDPVVSRGKVYLYQQSPTGNWPDTPSAVLEPDTIGQVVDRFGQALATDGETLFIGSRETNNLNPNVRSSLFIAEKSSQGWQSATLKPRITFDLGQGNPAFSLVSKGDSLFVGRQFRIDPDAPLAELYRKPATGWGSLAGSGIPLRLVNRRDNLLDYLMLGWTFDLENEYGIFGNWVGQNSINSQKEQGEVAFVKLAADCQPIAEIAAPIVGIGETGLTTVELAWETPGYSFRTELAYREADSSDPYRTLLSTDHREILTNLQPSTTYEYKVRNVCGPFGLPDTTAYSELQQFTTGMGGVTELVNVPLHGLEDIDHTLISRVAMDDSTAAVGLSDFRILVLENQDSVWRRVATLTPSTPPSFHHLAIDGGTIVAANYPVFGTPEGNSGQLYIWEKPETGWEDREETAKVVIPPLFPGGQNIFGIHLEVSGETIVTNTLFNNGSTESILGSIYVVEKTNGRWDENPPARLSPEMNGRIADFGNYYGAFGFYFALAKDLVVGMRPLFTGNSAPRYTPLDDFRRNPLAFVKPSSGWTTTTNESFPWATVNPGYLLAETQNYEGLAGEGDVIVAKEVASSSLLSLPERTSFSITELSQTGDWAEAPQVKSINPTPDLFDFSAAAEISGDRLLVVNNYRVPGTMGVNSNHVALYHKTSDSWADAALGTTANIVNSDGLDPESFLSFDQSGPFSGFVLWKANTLEDKLQFFTENRYCVTPTNVQTVVSNNSLSPVVTISWESLPTSSSWEVAYRPAGSEEPFTIVSTLQKMLVISEGLLFGTSYEYNIRSLCQDYPDLPVSAPTALLEFTTPCLPPANLLSSVEVEQDNSYEISLTWEEPHPTEGYEMVIALGDSTIADLQSTETGVILNSDLVLNQEYQVQVRSVCGQPDTPFYSEYAEGTFQLNEFIPEALKLYPNPTTGKVTVEVPISQIDLQMPYQVVDQLGKTVSDGVISRNNFEIDFTYLHPGVYALRLIQMADNNVLRVVKF